MDLHWCDLAALVGFPGEGESPWDSDDENVKVGAAPLVWSLPNVQLMCYADGRLSCFRVFCKNIASLSGGVSGDVPCGL